MLYSFLSFSLLTIFLAVLPLCIDAENIIPVKMPSAIEVSGAGSNVLLTTGGISLTSVVACHGFLVFMVL